MSSQFSSEKEETILEEVLQKLSGTLTYTDATVTKYEFTYDEDKDISTLVAKQNEKILFTLTFTYDAEKNLISITRSS